MSKYSDEEKQEVFNEWLGGILSKMKTDAILADADTFEAEFGKQMDSDDAFTATFKIILKKKESENA